MLHEPLLPQPIELAQIVLEPGLATETRVRVHYIGAVDGKSIMVTHPVKEDRPLLLSPGESLLVRLVSRRCVLGFHTTIAKTCAAPFAYLHLHWPRQVSRTPLRKTPRISTRILATAELHGRTASVCIRDLSLEGARLDEVSGAKPGDILRLTFQLSDSVPLTLVAAVRNTIARDDTTGLGVQFVNLLPETRGVLAEFLLREGG